VYHYGGIYIDLDVLVLRDFNEILDMSSNKLYITYEPSGQTNALYNSDKYLCNAFFAANKKNNMLKLILDKNGNVDYQDKNKMLASVSFDYAMMASIQFLYLIFFQGMNIKSHHLIGVVIALLVRHFLGKKVFHFTSERNYQLLFNGFILMNALVLGAGVL
jgi:hypothetical protein